MVLLCPLNHTMPPTMYSRASRVSAIERMKIGCTLEDKEAENVVSDALGVYVLDLVPYD